MPNENKTMYELIKTEDLIKIYEIEVKNFENFKLKLKLEFYK